MREEELKKEAYLFAKNSKDVQNFECGFDIAFKSYLAGAEPREKRIAELEAQNLQLLKEWRVMDKAKQKAELKVAELMGDVSTLEQDYKKLEAQIEKMKCCLNCKYRYCGGSSVSIDKNGNRTFHNWNKEKQEYCDVGKNGKYQCWELAE